MKENATRAESQSLRKRSVGGYFRCILGFSLLLMAIISCSSLHAALLGFYPFDGNEPQADASGTGRDLESVGADPTFQATGGFEGGGYSFDGNQRWVAPIDINPGTLPQMTMGAWVKTASLAPGLRKIMGSDDGGWDRTIGLDDREGPFRYTSFIGNGNPALGGPGPVSTNQWTFFAVTYDSVNSQLTMYIDLDAVSREPLVGVTVPSSFGSGFDRIAIGAIRPDVQSEGWVGSIDNAFVYDELLTPERLTEIRNGGRKAILGLTPDDPNLAVSSAPNLDGLPKVPNVKTFSFPIVNNGSAQTLHITNVTLAGLDAGYYSVQSFPATLAPGESSALVFQLDSAGEVGRYSGTATVTSDDPTTPSLLLDLSARVVSAQTLLGFYSFDDAANPLKDESGANRTLVSGTAPPTYAGAGGFNGSGAFTYDGTQRLAAPININPSVEPRLTMGAWVKTASLETGLRKVLGSDDGGWDRTIGLDDRNDVFRYTAFAGNGPPVPGTPSPVSTEDWTFLAADYDQTSGKVAVYVDLDASTTADELQRVEYPASAGAGATSVGIGAINPAGGEYWLGSIDNVFFVRGAVDAATMRAIRDGGRSTLLQFGPDPVLLTLTSPVFGDLPNGATRTVQLQVRNGGASQPLTIVRARFTGRDAARFSVGALPGPIAPGATAAIAVTLTPQGRQGLLLGTLELTSNDSDNRTTLIDVTANVPFSDPSAALIGFYTFDDPAAPLKDVSGHGNDLTMVTGAEPTFSPVSGFLDGAFDFNGSQRLIAPININPSARPVLTMGAWIKASSLGGLHKVIGSDDGGWDRTIGMDDRGVGGLRYTTFIGNGEPLANTPTPTSLDGWSFIAATYSEPASQVVMYVDLDASTIDDPLVVVSSPSGFGSGFSTTAIGGLRPDNANEGWIGSIDNVFFYDKVLTVDELTTLRDQQLALAHQLKIRSITRTDVGVAIVWRSVPNEFYEIEYTESLGGPWQLVGVGGSATQTADFIDTDPDRLARPTGFYRIKGEE